MNLSDLESYLGAGNLIDVALGRNAVQSSTSRWSVEAEAQRAVSEENIGSFAFHTEHESSPWWQVDLGVGRSLALIVIHNRLDSLQERARRIRVEVSADLSNWTLVHAGHVHFGGGNGPLPPLMLPLGSKIFGRYVKLSLDEAGPLHLSKVQVYATAEAVAQTDYYHQNGIRFSQSSPNMTRYRVWIGDAAARHLGTGDAQVNGLDITYSGRFGNLLHQYVHAIQIARRTGLRLIRLGAHPLLDIEEPFELDGIMFLPRAASAPASSVLLQGEFFNSDDFAPVLSPFLRYEPEEEAEFTEITRRFIRDKMLRGIRELVAPIEDELVVHVRSGDVFQGDQPVTYGYRQPPLSFYRLVISRMMEAGTIRSVKLVFEDRGNPCIDPLEDWLSVNSIPYEIHSGSLASDMEVLINARHAVFGHGTFGYAACRLSRTMRSVHFFAPQLGGRYECIPGLDDVHEVSDAEGKYIRAFEYGKPFGSDEGWRNTPEMRQRMISYPGEYLAVRKL